MKLEFAPRVEFDLQEIGDWIAKDNSARAITFIHELGKAALRVASNPFLYRLRPEIGDNARIAIVDNYLLLFRVLENTHGQFVRIERIVNGARDLTILMD